MQHHLELLGLKVRDVVTNVTGTVVNISFDIAGCVQGLVVPVQDKKDGKMETYWFDTKRLVALNKKPAIPISSFEAVAGGTRLPSISHAPGE
mgnify:CR=1 FL=1